jgi:hypothetical protein
MHRNALLSICLLCTMQLAIGQTLPQSTDLKQIMTPSPTASALGQYGNVPVGLYTGSAQVTIPLYEVEQGSLSLPITLSYNSGGNKVADMASWVGLGFSLNAGGCITRTVYGLPDENRRTSPAFVQPISPTGGQIKEELMNAVDYQPDVFYFNFNGRSGKFTLSNTSTISIAPHQNLKIQAYDGGGAPLNPPFYEVSPLMFRITDENGIVYEFKDYETNRTVSFNPNVTQDPLLTAIGVPPPSATAWYLTDMYSPTGDTIRFVYGTYTVVYDLPSSEQQFVFETGQTISQNVQPTQPLLVENAVRCQNQNKRLQQILFSNGSVNFTARQPREDFIGDTVLNQMMVYRNNGTAVKGWSFNYQYSVAGNPTLVTDTSAPGSNQDNYYATYIENVSTSSNWRLMLTGISELDKSYNTDGRNYSFMYDMSHNALPGRFSKKRDYWGYSNGNDYSESSFLTYQLTGSNTDPNSYLITGKEPDSNFCRQNSLKQVTYPTGGYTQFNYALHDAYVGRGVLPPVVSSQNLTMTIDFPSYPDGYTDTVINGLNCVYTTFTFTSSSGGYANIAISNIMYQQSLHPLLRFDIYDSNNNPYLLMSDLISNAGTQIVTNQINSTTITYNYTLSNYFFSAGTYKVIFYPIASFIGTTTYLNTYLGQPSFVINGWSNITYNTDSVDISRNIGGLRIRSTVDYDPVTNKYLEKGFSYILDGSSLSSGSILSGASYIYPLKEFLATVVTLDGGYTQDYTGIYNYMIINSESNYALSTTQGAYVGYSTVTETDVDPATGIPNGKSEYHYTSPNSFPDYYGASPGPTDNFPYPPPDARDWQRGLLLQRTDYQYINNQYLPVKIENDTYSAPIYVDTAYGFIGRYLEEVFPAIADSSQEVSIDGDEFSNPEVFSGVPYYLTGGYVPLLSKAVTMIQNGDSITETTNYTYADAPANMLPTSIAAIDSKGNINTTYLKYPFDYTLNSPVTSQGQGLLNLQQNHILAPVVEKFVQKTSSSGTDMGAISGLYTTFKPAQTLPDTMFRLQSAAPVLGYTPIVVADGGTTMNSNYTSYVSFGSYDGYGNLLQQSKVYDLLHSYLWDYHEKAPIAEITNAQQSDVAYTSFEADGTGNWTIGTGTVDATTAITGNSSYNLTSSISKSGLTSSNTYIVSYWTLGSAGAFSIAGTISGYPVTGKTVTFNNASWTLYVHKVTGQSTITVSGNGHIDELRLYPATAQMTTYTYDPLVGMTTQTDAGNRATYYQYDGLARLIRIRDQDYNILKTIAYQYQAPAGCGSGCYAVTMQTFAGSNTLSYPVGVFNVNGKLLGNVTNATAYVSEWNSDTADNRLGTLTAGTDSMHFNLALNAGQTLPAGVTGCRYYQWDLPWTNIDGILGNSGAYVAFGDGTGVKIPKTPTDTVGFGAHNVWLDNNYLVHTYPDSSLKTITIYHSDGAENIGLDNANSPATSLTKVRHLRGYFPQHTIGGKFSSMQQSNALTMDSIWNWNSISSVITLQLTTGDGGINACKNVHYAQDFMKNNAGLQTLITDYGAYNSSGVLDTTFKLTLLKSNWNTYFTNLQDLQISDDHWNRENLSALIHLQTFIVVAGNHDGYGSFTPIPYQSVDSIINQIASGAGQNVSNGLLGIASYGGGRSAASNASVNFLLSKGWKVILDGVYLTPQ